MSAAASAGGDEAKAAIWSLRMCACACAILPMIYFSTICGLYWGMLSEAQDYNDANDPTDA